MNADNGLIMLLYRNDSCLGEHLWISGWLPRHNSGADPSPAHWRKRGSVALVCAGSGWILHWGEGLLVLWLRGRGKTHQRGRLCHRL